MIRRTLFPAGIVFTTLIGAAPADAPPTSSSQPLMQLSTLLPTVGEPVEVRLNLPTGENWANANIGAFFVRQGTEQWSVPIEPVAGGKAMMLTFGRPGTALVVLAAGRAEDRGFSDSWQRTPYCSKAVVRVLPSNDAKGANPIPGGGITGKVGHKIEILPLVHPGGLHIGDHLPVRVYFAGSKRTGVTVQASVKKAGVEEAVAVKAMRPTDSVGTTWFELEHAGQWRLSWSEEVDGLTHTAELVFELAGNAEITQKAIANGGQR